MGEVGGIGRGGKGVVSQERGGAMSARRKEKANEKEENMVTFPAQDLLSFVHRSLE